MKDIIWATLKINIYDMEEERRVKLNQALILLNEIGIGFDTGTCGNHRDIELDWSLTGATLCATERSCMLCNSKDKLKRYPIESNETIYENYCFCSSDCHSKYQRKLKEKESKEENMCILHEVELIEDKSGLFCPKCEDDNEDQEFMENCKKESEDKK